MTSALGPKGPKNTRSAKAKGSLANGKTKAVPKPTTKTTKKKAKPSAQLPESRSAAAKRAAPKAGTTTRSTRSKRKGPPMNDFRLWLESRKKSK